jgi:hypothetical protein
MAISNINSLSLDPSGGFPASATATVATSQTTTSTSYTDLATAGPAVTVTTGTKALVIFSAQSSNSSLGSTNSTSFAVSGATTIAASDSYKTQFDSPLATYLQQQTQGIILTGLTAGSNTFTLKYKVTSSTGTWITRIINVIDMGS